MRVWYLFILLLVLAVIDWKRRVVPDKLLLLLFAGEAVLTAVAGETGPFIRQLPAGAVFFAAIRLFSWLSKGRFGMGDARLLGVIGLTAGAGYAFRLLFFGMLLSFFWGVWLLAMKRAGAKEEIPFVPFLAAGMAVSELLMRI